MADDNMIYAYIACGGDSNDTGGVIEFGHLYYTPSDWTSVRDYRRPLSN